VSEAAARQADPALRGTRLGKAFGQRVLWRELDIRVHAGQMLALVGPSGSGKSTLLNCLGLLESLDHGSITMSGREVTRLGAGRRRRLRRDTLGYLFQNYALIDNATVRQNLDVVTAVMPRRGERGAASAVRGGPAARRGASREMQREALQRVGLLGRERERVFNLSGGEQQRVALARLLVKRPAIVLADEPTGALDRVNAEMVIGVLRELSGQGCAIVVATHDAAVAAACDALLDLAAASSS